MSTRLSSITKKVLMAIVGLFLVVFLLVHLGINLFILPLTENHVEIFESAAAFMGSNPLIKVFEVVLFLALIGHLFIGVMLFLQNRMARPVRYYSTNKSETSFFSKYMIHTGIIIFVFLLLHFVNFYFVKLGFVEPPVGVDKHDFYTMAVLLFNQPLYSIFYIISFLFLGFHLNHAFQSAFQSLGMNHDKYTPVIKRVSTVYSVIVAVGFSIIPIYFLIAG